jgi:hypothetical protein
MDFEPTNTNSLLDPESRPQQPSLPTIEPVDADRVIPRQTSAADGKVAPKKPIVEKIEPTSKRDWL